MELRTHQDVISLDRRISLLSIPKPKLRNYDRAQLYSCSRRLPAHAELCEPGSSGRACDKFVGVMRFSACRWLGLTSAQG